MCDIYGVRIGDLFVDNNNKDLIEERPCSSDIFLRRISLHAKKLDEEELDLLIKLVAKMAKQNKSIK